MEKSCQHPCRDGHDGVLCQGANEDVCGARQQDAEVLCGECAPHGQHDKSQDDRSTLSLLYPCKGVGHEEGYDGYDDDEEARIAGEVLAEGE